MANLKAISQRIRSLSATKKITSAMKMVAVSKYKKQEAYFENYKNTYNEILSIWENSSGWRFDFSDHPMFKKQDGEVLHFVLFPDKGLCGGLVNSTKKYAQGMNLKNAIFVGEKGGQGALIFETFKEIFDYFDNFFQKNFKNVSKIFCIRPVFKNILVSNIVCEQIFPFEVPENRNQKGIIEQSFLTQFLIHMISSKFWNMILEMKLCEYTSRMVAMDQANKNTTDLINTLQKTYNRTRQSQITKELIEIVAGSVEV